MQIKLNREAGVISIGGFNSTMGFIRIEPDFPMNVSLALVVMSHLPAKAARTIQTSCRYTRIGHFHSRHAAARATDSIRNEPRNGGTSSHFLWGAHRPCTAQQPI